MTTEEIITALDNLPMPNETTDLAARELERLDKRIDKLVTTLVWIVHFCGEPRDLPDLDDLHGQAPEATGDSGSGGGSGRPMRKRKAPAKRARTTGKDSRS